MEDLPNQQIGTPQQDHKAVGPMIGLIIILIVIVAGGLYFLMNREPLTSQPESLNNNNQTQTESATPPPTEETINSQGSSDEVDSIEADLNSFSETDINALDSDL